MKDKDSKEYECQRGQGDCLKDKCELYRYIQKEGLVATYQSGIGYWEEFFGAKIIRLKAKLGKLFYFLAALASISGISLFSFSIWFFADPVGITIIPWVTIVCALVIFVIFLQRSITYLKYRTNRSIDIKNSHAELQLTTSQMYQKLSRAAINPNCAPEALEKLTTLCGRFKTHFQLHCPQTPIGLAVRLLSVDDEANPTFKTAVRINLSDGRAETSEPIPADEGIPNYFSQHPQNVLIYHQLTTIAQCTTLFKKTKSETDLPNEIGSLMVTPIKSNLVDDEYKIIGLLYITSSKSKFFSQREVDLVRFGAHLLAPWIGLWLNIMEKRGNEIIEETNA